MAWWRKILVLICFFTGLQSAQAEVKVGAELFANYQVPLNDSTSDNGFDVDRLRLFLFHTFDEKWVFRSEVDFFAESDSPDTQSDMPIIRVAGVFGKNVLTSGDWLGIGAQAHPVLAFTYPTLGTRWISVAAGHGTFFVPFSAGVSYRQQWLEGLLSLQLFASSHESASITDQDDSEGEYATFLKLKPLEGLKFLTGFSVTTPGTPGANSFQTLSLLMTYKVPSLRLALEYYSKQEVLSSSAEASGAVEPEADTVCGLTTQWSPWNEVGLFARYFSCYDEEDANQGQLLVGPTTTIGEEKINVGVFYELKTFKATSTVSKQDSESAVYVKLGSRFR